jgi:acyl carrier protein
LKEKEIDFCAVMSSLAAVLGGVGFGPYAAANIFMDSFVRRCNRTSRTPWLSINWDLWSSEESRDEITEARGDLSNLAMSPREGEEAFRRALSAPNVDQLVVSTAELPARLVSNRRRFSDLRPSRAGGSGNGAVESLLHSRPPLPTSYVAPETELERRIAAVWRQVLGFEQIGIDDNFFDLGGDSLIAIRVVSRMKRDLEVDFPVAKLYQGVTVRTLAQLLAQDEEQEQQRRAAQLAEHKQTADRRRDYIERRRSRK